MSITSSYGLDSAQGGPARGLHLNRYVAGIVASIAQPARISQEMGRARDEGNSLLGVGMSLEQVGDPSGAADAYRRSVELLETAHEVSRMPEELSAKAEALTLLANILDRHLHEPEAVTQLLTPSMFR